MPKNQAKSKGVKKGGLACHSPMCHWWVMMKEGNSGGELSEPLWVEKGPEGVERWAESLCNSEPQYQELQRTLSSDFTPPVSEDSTPGDRLPEALQADNTGFITLRRTGRLYAALHLTER